jgi:hypothetical protein
VGGAGRDNGNGDNDNGGFIGGLRGED